MRLTQAPTVCGQSPVILCRFVSGGVPLSPWGTRGPRFIRSISGNETPTFSPRPNIGDQRDMFIDKTCPTAIINHLNTSSKGRVSAKHESHTSLTTRTASTSSRQRGRAMTDWTALARTQRWNCCVSVQLPRVSASRVHRHSPLSIEARICREWRLADAAERSFSGRARACECSRCYCYCSFRAFLPSPPTYGNSATLRGLLYGTEKGSL